MTAINIHDVLAQAQGHAPTVEAEPETQAVVTLTPEAMQAIKDFTAAKQLAAIAKAAKETAERVIREALGDAVLGTFEGKPVVQIAPGHNTHVDGDLLMQGWPEAYNACKTRTDYTSVRVLKQS